LTVHDQLMFVSTLSGTFYAVSKQTGKTLWTLNEGLCFQLLSALTVIEVVLDCKYCNITYIQKTNGFQLHFICTFYCIKSVFTSLLAVHIVIFFSLYMYQYVHYHWLFIFLSWLVFRACD